MGKSRTKCILLFLMHTKPSKLFSFKVLDCCTKNISFVVIINTLIIYKTN